jgi:hypothetical protein
MRAKRLDHLILLDIITLTILSLAEVYKLWSDHYAIFIFLLALPVAKHKIMNRLKRCRHFTSVCGACLQEQSVPILSSTHVTKVKTGIIIIRRNFLFIFDDMMTVKMMEGGGDLHVQGPITLSHSQSLNFNRQKLRKGNLYERPLLHHNFKF